MFMKNCWYVAAWSHELIDDVLLDRTLLKQKVLLYRGIDGKVSAIDEGGRGMIVVGRCRC